jgi:hypothetical protein
MSGMKAKGYPTGSHIGIDESEARRSNVLEYADLHDPAARKRILERANQALKDARALIERLNEMEEKRTTHHPKQTKASKV